MREYETCFIVQPEISDEGSEEIRKRLDGVLESGGATRLMCEDLGKRKLAYEIRRFQKGHYYVLSFLDAGTAIPDVERTLRLEESVLRFMTFQVNESVADVEARIAVAREAELAQEKRAEDRAKRDAEEAQARAASERERAEAVAKERAEATAAAEAEAASAAATKEPAAAPEAAATKEPAAAPEAAATKEPAAAPEAAAAKEPAAAPEAAAASADAPEASASKEGEAE